MTTKRKTRYIVEVHTAELIRKLERLDPSAKVVLSHDGGHTYGGILLQDIREINH